MAYLTLENAYCLFVIRISQEQKQKEQEGEEFGEIFAKHCFEPVALTQCLCLSGATVGSAKPLPARLVGLGGQLSAHGPQLVPVHLQAQEPTQARHGLLQVLSYRHGTCWLTGSVI